MRKLSLVLAALTLVAALAATQAFAAATVRWKVGSKTVVTIHKGGTVKWVWRDSAPHNVKGPGFKSRTVSGKGKSYSHRFRSKGTFKIICQVHPTTMKTVVKVS